MKRALVSEYCASSRANRDRMAGQAGIGQVTWLQSRSRSSLSRSHVNAGTIRSSANQQRADRQGEIYPAANRGNQTNSILTASTQKQQSNGNALAWVWNLL